MDTARGWCEPTCARRSACARDAGARGARRTGARGAGARAAPRGGAAALRSAPLGRGVPARAARPRRRPLPSGAADRVPLLARFARPLERAARRRRRTAHALRPLCRSGLHARGAARDGDRGVREKGRAAAAGRPAREPWPFVAAPTVEECLELHEKAAAAGRRCGREASTAAFVRSAERARGRAERGRVAVRKVRGAAARRRIASSSSTAPRWRPSSSRTRSCSLSPRPAPSRPT